MNAITQGFKKDQLHIGETGTRTGKTSDSSTQLILGKLYFAFNAFQVLKTYFHAAAFSLSGGGEVYFLYLRQEKYVVCIH